MSQRFHYQRPMQQPAFSQANETSHQQQAQSLQEKVQALGILNPSMPKKINQNDFNMDFIPFDKPEVREDDIHMQIYKKKKDPRLTEEKKVESMEIENPSNEDLAKAKKTYKTKPSNENESYSKAQANFSQTNLSQWQGAPNEFRYKESRTEGIHNQIDEGYIENEDYEYEEGEKQNSNQEKWVENEKEVKKIVEREERNKQKRIEDTKTRQNVEEESYFNEAPNYKRNRPLYFTFENKLSINREKNKKDVEEEDGEIKIKKKPKPNNFKNQPTTMPPQEDRIITEPEKKWQKNNSNKFLTKERRIPNKFKEQQKPPKPHFYHNFHKDPKELMKELAKETIKLPIFAQKQNILDSIKKHQVVIISGPTGCGKSTQIPKYLYEQQETMESTSTSNFKLMIAQPRRIGAITLAYRVSQELGVIFGKTIGQQIGLESGQTKDTKILQVTNGILLQYLTNNVGFLNDYSHLILDEIHERDMDSDFSMIALKSFLAENKNIKLILMSATINSQLFANQFSRDEIQNFTLKKDPDEHKKESQKNFKKQEKKIDPEWGYWNSQSKPSNEDIQPKPVSVWGRARNKTVEKQEISPKDLPATVIELHRVQTYKIALYQIENFDKQFDDFKIKYRSKDIIFSPVNFDLDSPCFYKECKEIGINLIKNIIHAEFDKEKEQKVKNFLVFLPGLNEIFDFRDILSEKIKERTRKQTIKAPVVHENGKQEIISKEIEENYIDETIVHKIQILCLHSALSDAENERVFEDSGKCRIILATNIAESAITVKDVGFIIDFCLTKETSLTASYLESLDLVWSSQASANQRAGRTGRTCNGVVFRQYSFSIIINRLVTKKFFDNEMKKQSTPEIQRSPLDKIILKIRNHQEEMKDLALNDNSNLELWKEPNNLLKKAIQPPSLENIGLAIKSLQDSGAILFQKNINLEDEKEIVSIPNLTFLGKLYNKLPCEIPIAKLCIMGYIFNCLYESITMASILHQQKSMFLINTSFKRLNQIKFQEMLKRQDEGRNFDLKEEGKKQPEEAKKLILEEGSLEPCKSDPILMMRLFMEWEKKFQPEVTVKQLVKPKWGRRQIYQPGEREWCSERYLDSNILKEVWIFRHEIIRRLTEMFNSPTNVFEKHLKLYSKEAILKLKLSLAAAFNSSQMEAVPMDESNTNDKRICSWQKMFKNKNIDSKKVLIGTINKQRFTQLSAAELKIAEQHWTNLFNNYGKVEKVNFDYDEGNVFFSEDTQESAITKVLYEDYKIKKEAKHGMTQMKEEPKNQNENEKDLTISLKDIQIEYLNQTKITDFYKKAQIAIDKDSINFFIFHKKFERQFLVAFGLQDRRNKRFAKWLTIMPQKPFFGQICCMLFNSVPKLRLSEDKTRYEKVNIDDADINLDFILKDDQIENINFIRSLINESVDSTHMKSWSTNDIIFTKVNDLLNQEFKPYHENERWETDFRHFERSILMQSVSKNQEIKASRPKQQKKQQRIKEENQHSAFLLPLDTITHEKGCQDWTREEGYQEYHNYWIRQIAWKEQILQEYDKTVKRCRLEKFQKTQLICSQEDCEELITEYSNIKELENNRWRAANLQNASITKLATRPENPKQDDYWDTLIEDFAEQMKEDSIEQIGCSKHHVFAFHWKKESMELSKIPNFIDLQFMLWNSAKTGKIMCGEQEKERIQKVTVDTSKNAVYSKASCQICGKKFDQIKDFLEHILEKEHKKLLIEFKKSLPKQSENKETK